MTRNAFLRRAEPPPIDLHAFAGELYPLARSLTGSGVRETLNRIGRHVPLDIREVASGTPVLDWTVPDEWTIRSATIATLAGETLVDFADHSLHVVGYSGPVDGVIGRDELAAHVHTLPDQPDAIPYRTGYYANDWGFCLSHRAWTAMTDPAYRVRIDSEIAPGWLTYGEIEVPGTSGDEILISVHVCHPSLANDNLSGIAVATALAARALRGPRRRLGLRFLFVPATIGAITWLERCQHDLGRIRHGLVLTCLGDDGPFHYKQARSPATIDRAVALALATRDHCILPFSPYGYDERQYCSPGFDLPVGCLMRGVHGAFPEYHTSLDNMDFISGAALDQSYALLVDILDMLEGDRVYRRIDGRGEPQLGRRGLYRALAGQADQGGPAAMDLLWFLNLADGEHSLIDMAERSQVPFNSLCAVAQLALEADLVEDIT